MDGLKSYYKDKFTTNVKPNNYLSSVYGREVANNGRMIPLNEISMNRLLGKHYNNGGFAIVSASRFDKTPAENEQNTQKMYELIRNSEFRFIPAFGGFVETNNETGEKKDNVDEKIAIILCFDRQGKEIPFERLYKFAFDLGVRFEQDSVLIKAPNDNPKYIVTHERSGKVGSVDMEFTGDIVLNDVTQQFFTNMANRRTSQHAGKNRFTFTECFLNPPFATLNEGQSRTGKGEIVFRPTQTTDLYNNKC